MDTSKMVDQTDQVVKYQDDNYYPMSAAQRRIYIQHSLIENSTMYNMPLVFELNLQLDIEVAEKMFKTLINRHESLRTSFKMVDGEPVQVVHQDVHFHVEQIEVTDETYENIVSALMRFIRPFDLDTPPLIRVGLITFAPDHHYMVIDVHHIISDGVSMTVITNELVKIFQGEKLAPLALQYKDYALQQRERLNQNQYKNHKEFWIKQLTEIPVLQFPTDYPRPAIKRYEGDLYQFEFDTDLTNKLNNIAKRNGATLYMLILAMYQVLLTKYSGQEDVIVGSPIAGRNQYEYQNIVGMFVNMLPMRGKPQGQKTFEQFLSEVRNYALEVYEYQDYPFDQMIEDIALPKDKGRHPVFDTVFVFRNMGELQPDFESQNAHSPMKQIKLPFQTSKFDIILHAREVGNQIKCSFEYSTSLFKQDTIKKMAERMVHLAEEIVDNPNVEIGQLSICTDEDRMQINRFNHSKVEFHNHTLVSLFEEQAKKNPSKIAIKIRNQGITYRELNDKANVVAGTIKHKKKDKNPIIGVMIEQSIELVAGILGILKAGAAYVPIHPEYPEERIQYILDDCDTSLLLTQRKYEHPNLNIKEIISIEEIIEHAKENEASQIQNREAFTTTLNTDQLAYVIYTSGTTGYPKGVMIEQGQIVNTIQDRIKRYNISPEQTHLNMFSLAFDGFVVAMFAPLCGGATLVLMEPDLMNDLHALINMINQEKVTHTFGVPSIWRTIVDMYDDRLPSLKVISLGGEQIHQDFIQRLSNQFDGVEITNEYGPTENSVITSIARHIEKDDQITIGRPISNHEIYIVDTYGNILPPGIPGEICVCGRGVARGYLNRPELTKEKFVTHPWSKEKRMYRTGDIGRWLYDGKVEYLGRNDEQVKVHGYRIETAEIEAQMLACEGIHEAIVVAFKNKNQQTHLCGYYTTKQAISNEKIKKELKQRLPVFMVPQYLVEVDQFPINANGKIDKKALPRPEETSVSQAEYVAPKTVTEKKLLELWSEELDHERISVRDDFFDLGGHSLIATRLVAKILKEFQVELSFKEVFEYTTIEQLAEVIELKNGQHHTSDSNIPVAPKREYYPLSSAQKRMYVLQQLNPEGTGYNVPQIIEVNQKLDTEQIDMIFRELANRHESLRTSFHVIDGQPMQKVHDRFSMDIEEIEVSKWDAAAFDETIATFIRPFDLQQAPLFRIGIIHAKQDRTIILIDLHHIICDGISMKVLENEFKAILSNEELEIPSLQYKDFAVWQNEKLRQKEFEEQRIFWRDQLSGEIPILDIPTDFARPKVKQYSGDIVLDEWGTELSEALKDLSSQSGTTLFIVLLSLYQILLARYAGQEDIVVGSPIAGRKYLDLEKIVGMFVNTLPIRGHPAESKSYIQFLDELKETVVKAYENQDFPFEDMVDDKRVTRDLSRNPLFDTMFTLQNIFTVDQKDETWPNIIEPQYKVSRFDLSLNVLERDERLLLRMEYSTDLFKSETITRMLKHLKKLAEEVVHQPRQLIGEINMCTQEDKKLLTTFNKTFKAYSDQTLVSLFESQVTKSRNHIALVVGDEQLTYDELNDKANKVAHQLKKDGIKADDLVAIVLDQSVEMVIGFLGVIKSGGAYVPIDPLYPDDRIEYLIKDSQAKIVLTEPKYEDRFNGDYQLYHVKDLVQVELDPRSIEKEYSQHISPSQLAYVIYTSGTTGYPKGVMIEHGQVSNMLQYRNEAYRISAEDRVLPLYSYAFDGSIGAFYSTLTKGATLYLMPASEAKDPIAMTKRIVKDKITHLCCVPSIYQSIMDCWDTNQKSYVHTLSLGGEKIAEAIVQRTKQWYPNIEIVNEYGPTENSVITTLSLSIQNHKKITVGKPIANTRVYVMNKHKVVQPIGVMGEIYISGKGLARGYLNRPELTHEKFVIHPQTGERLYKSGDLGRWLPDGQLEYLGRVDDQVKIRGHRIEPGEIENQLVALEYVKQAVVVTKKDKTGDPHLCAYIVTARTGVESEVMSSLKQKLPSYMLPARIVEIDKIPLSPNGKVNKHALPEISDNRKTEVILPRNEIERIVATVWKEVLNLKEVSIEDNFFEIGGHSLNTIQVVTALQKYQIEVDLIDLYEYQTLEELAQHILTTPSNDLNN